MAKTAEVPADLLVTAGEFLHGDEWKAPLARDLGLTSERLLVRWGDAAKRGETVRVSRTLLSEIADRVEAAARPLVDQLRRLAAEPGR